MTVGDILNVLIDHPHTLLRVCSPRTPYFNPSTDRCGSDAEACFKCPTTAATTIPAIEPTTEPV